MLRRDSSNSSVPDTRSSQDVTSSPCRGHDWPGASLQLNLRWPRPKPAAAEEHACHRLHNHNLQAFASESGVHDKITIQSELGADPVEYLLCLGSSPEMTV